MTSQVTKQELTQNKATHRSSEPVPIRPEHYVISVFERDDSSPQSRQARVDEKSVSVWQIEGSESIVETLLWRSGLAPAVRASLDSLVQRCGLDTLKDLYSNPISSGGTKFIISIWDPNRDHSTSSELKNCWVPRSVNFARVSIRCCQNALHWTLRSQNARRDTKTNKLTTTIGNEERVGCHVRTF